MSSQSSKFVADRSCYILNKNIDKIGNVNQWAKLAGFSRSWMWKCVKEHYGKTPKVILREVRYQKIEDVISKNPNISAKLTASMVAPWTEVHLYNFLNNHYGKNFTILRFEILEQKK